MSLILTGEEYNNLIVPLLISLLINPIVNRGRYRYSLSITAGNNPSLGAKMAVVKKERDEPRPISCVAI